MKGFLKMKAQHKRYFSLIGILGAISLIIALFGNACSELRSNSQGNAWNLNSQCTQENIEFDYKEGAETASIAYGPQVLESMVACTGVMSVSQQTLDTYNDRRASLSEYGSVMDMNPPLAMAHAAIAAEVCTDLFEQELQMSADQRRIFNAVLTNFMQCFTKGSVFIAFEDL